MKAFFTVLLLALLAAFSLPAEEEFRSWSSDFRKARNIAKANGKNLFLLFTISDGDLKNQRAIQLFRYSSAFAREAGKDFLFLHIDSPRKKKLSWEDHAMARRLRNRFGVSFFPAVVIVSPSSPWGGLLYRYNGLPPSWQELMEEIRKKVKKPVRKAPPAAIKEMGKSPTKESL